MPEEKATNYTREAFLHPLNLVMLIAATTAAFFLNDVGTLPSVIFSMAFGIELIYLGTVPRLPNFRKSVDIRKASERKKAEESTSVFKGLDRDSQQRFLVLKHLSKLIKENFQKLPFTAQGMLENISHKIDGLLKNYLELLELHRKYKVYLQSSAEAQIKAEIAEERAEMDASTSERLKNIKARRVAILVKRLERFKTAREKFAISDTQLQTIEDAVRYVYEQSMTMNNPEEIDFQLDNLLIEVEETATLMDDADIDVSVPGMPLLDDLDAILDPTENTGSSNTGIRQST